MPSLARGVPARNVVVRVDVVTLFPEMVETLLRFGVTGRAVERGLLTVATWDPRDRSP
jgi:tRNA (guanine37-N1)-methyltransferase